MFCGKTCDQSTGFTMNFFDCKYGNGEPKKENIRPQRSMLFLSSLLNHRNMENKFTFSATFAELGLLWIYEDVAVTYEVLFIY